MYKEIMVQYTSKDVSMLTKNGTIAYGWIQVIITNRILQIIALRNNKYKIWSINRNAPCIGPQLNIILRNDMNTILINNNVLHFIKTAHYVKIKQALIDFGYIKSYTYSKS